MEKYTIEYSKQQEEDSGYISIPVVEPITSNECIGDSIGIYQDGNVLEFSEYVDIDDVEVKDFIKQHFKDSQSVFGFMRRVLS